MIENDFYIANDRVIRHVADATTIYTVLELHRFLSDLADRSVNPNSNAPDNDIDILSPLPSVRQTDYIIKLINGYYIDEETAKFLHDGSIIQYVEGNVEIWT